MSLIHHEKTQITLDTKTGLMWQDDIKSKIIKLSFLEAQEYSRNLRLGGFSDWEIPNSDVLLDLSNKRSYLKNFNDAMTYTSSTEWGLDKIKVVSFSQSKVYYNDKEIKRFLRCVRNKKIFNSILEIFNYKKIAENTIVLSSLDNELYYFKSKDKDFFGFFSEIYNEINVLEMKDSGELSEIITKRLEQKIKEYLRVDEIKEPKSYLSDKDSFIKDEFETQAEFDERVSKFIDEQTKSYELHQIKYLEEVKQREIEYNKRVENLGDIKKDFLFEIFAQTMGIPLLKDAFYVAETNDMYMTLFMTNYFWEKRIKVNIQDRIVAKDFKTKLNEVKIDATFDLENEEFIFDKVELEFDNNKFTGTQTNEVINQEKIKIDFHLTEEILDLEHQKDIQLPKYTLEVKTLDNQKLEEEIQILKEKLQISEDNNQNSEILNQEIEELKESKLSLENILSIKEDKIISLKNDNKIILIQIEDLKQELVSKNSEIEELGKSNLKIHEITSHFENILKIKEDEIISFKNTNEKIIKDNQVLNNQLINKNYEIEELKKYCNELQLNFSKQEQQPSSKVVERESFSDF